MRAAVEDGEVLLFEVARLHLLAEATRRLARLGKDHDAARGTVETVHEPHIHVAGLVVCRADVFAHLVEKVLIPALVGAGREVLRLQDHDDMIVFIEDGELFLGSPHLFDVSH